MAAIRSVRWVVQAQGETRLEPFSLPPLESGQILVRTEASLVSAGTELAIFTGIHQGLTNPHVPWPKYPQAMGYMAVVTVEEVGSGVTGVKIGDRLLTSTGHAAHAVLEVAALDESRCWRLPSDSPAHHLVFARMAKTAVTALCNAEVTLAQSVAVVGLGIIGQITVRLFEAAGAWPIVGVDPVALRREAARRGGAVAAVDPDAGADAGKAIREWLPTGADIVVDATGWASALPGAMSCATDGGRVVVLGSPRGTAPDVDFYRDLHRRSLRVIGAHDSGVGPQPRERFVWTNQRMVPAVVEWVRRGKLPVADLITHHAAPAELPAMYQGLLNEKEQYLGVVLDWGRL
jgi:2-desacetyl-2-hydroxyethyl bacteriochlorophyllide A dehydrogenase